MSRHPYTLSLLWGSGPSAIVLADIDFVVEIEARRSSRADDFEIVVVALAIAGLRKVATGVREPPYRWVASTTGNLLVTQDRVLRAIADWATDAISADDRFCSARIEEAREAASEAADVDDGYWTPEDSA